MQNLKAAKGRRLAGLEAVEDAAHVEKMPPAEILGGEKLSKKVMTSRALKRHLKYLIPEMRLVLVKESGIKPQPITMPEDLEKFVEPLKFYSEEHFVSFHLDVKFNVTGYHIVSRGTVSASLVHPREVFKAALLANSTAIIVAHNHPGGSLEPSAEDIETTRQLIKAGKLMGVQVLDHVIVTASDIRSLREHKSDLWFE